jgi:AcrR family transcriptional regulator
MASHTSDDTRAKILAEAERLFRHYGYTKTTIGDISEACTMSPANIYRFFPSKSALTEAICCRVIGSIEEQLLTVVRTPAPASERLRKFIATIYQNTLENLLDHRKVHEMVVIAMEEQWFTLRSFLDRVTGLFAEIIRDGIETGEFAPCDVARAAKCTHASVVTLCHPALVAVKLDEEDRVTPDEMANYVINALKQGGATTPKS